jgi:hypothetical protein
MNNSVQKMNSMIPTFANNSAKAANSIAPVSSTASNAPSSGFGGPVMWFSVLLVVLMGLLYVYYDRFIDAMQGVSDTISGWFTGNPDPPEEESEPMPLTHPNPPQDDDTRNNSTMIEKILPPAKEVFTVSKNNYSYYDAAPLCKALGAELATYEDVKNAWQGGADWCNYGWVKGQMAVYPTQKSTYEELQQGPEDQRGACGKPGVNGGYFDNPELKYGVTCTGKRPSQSQHDATAVTSGSTRPLTSSGLEFEKRVQHFKTESDNLGILPFNKEKWGGM